MVKRNMIRALFTWKNNAFNLLPLVSDLVCNTLQKNYLSENISRLRVSIAFLKGCKY